MQTDYAAALVNRANDLKMARGTYDQKCAEIAEVMRPLRAEFRGALTADAKRTQKLFDGTSLMAGLNLASGLYGTMTNPTNEWCGYESGSEELNASYRAKRWMEKVSRIALNSVSPSWSQFYAQQSELFLDIVFFGQGYMSSELRPDMSGFIDICRPISECYHDVDDEGTVNVMFRIWRTTAAKAASRFGLENMSNEAQRKAKTDPKKEIEIIHAVLPADDYTGKEIGKGRHRFKSCYIEVDTKEVIREGGYFSFPYMVPRWSVAAGEINGRGPGELALGDTMSLQLASKSNLNVGALQADPPWLAPDEGVISKIRLEPHGITYGGINRQGKPMVTQAAVAGGLPYSADLINGMREQCKDYFFFSIMQLVGRTGMTATEIVERQEERLRLIAPYVGRINTEDLAPFMLRRYDMFRQVPGLLPPPPPELNGTSLQVSFKSPMAMVQKSQTATAVLRAWQVVGQMAQADPTVLDNFDAVTAAKLASEGFGAPTSIWRDPDTAAQMTQQRQQAQQQAQQMQSMQMGADAAQKAAAAYASGAQVPA